MSSCKHSDSLQARRRFHPSRRVHLLTPKMPNLRPEVFCFESTVEKCPHTSKGLLDGPDCWGNVQLVRSMG